MEETAARTLRVTLRYFDGCPHWRILYDRLRQVLREEGLVDVEAVLEQVETPEDAERLRFVGSPTILIEGRDPFRGRLRAVVSHLQDTGWAGGLADAGSAASDAARSRGTVLEPEGEGPDGLSVRTPCVVRLHDGSVGMWYAGIPIGDEELGYRICLARFPGPWFT